MDRIRALREARGYTQQEVADAVNISRISYVRYESGERENCITIYAYSYWLLGFRHIGRILWSNGLFVGCRCSSNSFDRCAVKMQSKKIGRAVI